MKRQYVASMVIVVASTFVVGITLAAQDRFTLKAPNGIAYSEFKDYETWQAIAPSQPADAGGCGSAPPPGCIKVIAGNPAMIKAYKEGFPANGKPVPDGAMLAKIEWAKETLRPPVSAYEVTVPGKYIETTFMLRDSKRFPKTDGWGYASFRYDAKTDTFKAFGDGPEFANTCHACHTAFVKARDFVFTDYQKR